MIHAAHRKAAKTGAAEKWKTGPKNTMGMHNLRTVHTYHGKGGRRPRRKNKNDSPKGMMHFFGTGVMLKFADSPIHCATVRGDDGLLPYMVGSEKGLPKQQNKG